MYPTGGYGNFLYYLLSEHLESTVKLPSSDWEFEHGNSHQYPKYTESFLLGKATWQGTLKNFKYDYCIRNELAELQIHQGKQFLVLADVGNKGDNVNFLRRYFPNAKIVRVFAETFIERLIVWTNCMTKSNSQLTDSLYPGTILTREGIAIWSGKPIDKITDTDAIDCMVQFFQSDFGIYGKMFSAPTPGVINISTKSLFSQDGVCQLIQHLAENLNTNVVEFPQLKQIAAEFIDAQLPLSLLTPGDTFPLVRAALSKYGHTY